MTTTRRLHPRPRGQATAALVTVAILLVATGAATARTASSQELRQHKAGASDASDAPANGYRSDGPVVVPVTFEPNVGQAPASTAFVARGQRFVARFVPGGLDIALSSSATGIGKDLPGRPAGKRQAAAKAEVLSMRFEGAQETVRYEGRDRLEGVANYLGGSDESKWLRNVPTFRSVRAIGLYPGIDAEFYERSGNLEYDLIVAPGADASVVRLRFKGAHTSSVDTAGAINLRLDGGEIRHTRAACYQVEEGGRRIPVAGSSRLNADGTFGFELGEFDRSLALVIDPVLEFATFLGGSSGLDSSTAIAVDSSGAIYLAGITASADFPVTPGAFDTSGHPTSFSSNYFDTFVVKLDSSATSILYATYLGGSFEDYAYGIGVDATGSAVVVGNTNSADFPVTPGAFDTTLGQNDGFVVRLNATGTGLIYSTFFGGSSSESATAVVVDASGVATVTGYTYSADFPTTAGAFDVDFGGGPTDGFVTRLAANGANLVYSTFLGGNGFDYPASAVAGGSGAVCLTGQTESFDFPTTPGAFAESKAGAADAFVTKLSADGSSIHYSSYFGGSNSDDGVALRLASSNDIVFAGGTGSPDLPTSVGAFDTSFGGIRNGFVARLSSDASTLMFSTYIGGSEYDYITGLDLAADDDCVIVGQTSSPDFPTTPGAFDTSFSVNGNGYVSKLQSDGSALAFSTFVAGASPHSVDVDVDGSILVTGDANSLTFPHSPGAFAEPRDVGSAFVLRLSGTGSSLVFSRLIGGDTGQTDTDYATAHATDATGNIYLLGQGAFSIPTTPGAYEENGGGTFVTKLDPTGTTLIYSTFIPRALGATIEVGSTGSAHVGGEAYMGFATTPSAFDTLFDGDTDGFVAVLSADGSELVYSTLLGGISNDRVTDLAVDGSGATTVVGGTASADFPATPGAFDTTFGGPLYGYDGFAARLSATGSTLVWSTFLGGSVQWDVAFEVELDALNRPTVLGGTSSIDFPVTAGVYDPSYNGGESGQSYDVFGDMFLARLASNGSSLEYSTFIGGSEFEDPGDLAIDGAGNAYVVGRTASTDYPITPGSADSFFSNGEALLTKLDSNGATLIYSTFIGGGSLEGANAVKPAADGSVLVGGWTYSLNFPTTPGALRRQLGGSQDGFITKVSPAGNAFTYSTLLGGDAPDGVADLSITSTGEVIVSGSTSSSDFAQTGFGDRDSSNAFVARLRPISNGVDLSITKSHAGVFRVGSSESYTLTVTNQGSDPSSAQIVLSDVLPAGLSFVSGNGVDWTVGAVGQTVTATRATPLASGASSVVTLVVTPSALALPGVTNTASVATSNDVNLLNNTASDPTTVTRGTADISITNVESADPVVTGAMLTYTIVVRNDGPDPALDVVASDPLGTGTVFASASVSQGTFTAPSVGQPGTVSASFGTIGSGQQATLTVTTTVIANGGSVITNTATVATSSADANQLNNFASVSTGVVGTPLLGSDTIGITVSATGAWFLKNANTPGGADLVFGFGPPAVNWVALKGDWNGDGVDTPGLYDPSTGAFFLRNSSSPGPADLVFTFGPGALGWMPVAGDWDGNGADSVGLYVPDTAAFFLKNTNAPGAADIVFTFGPTGAGSVPLAGDWDGDGDDAIGLYIPSTATFFLKNANSPGPADTAFTFGGPSLVPVTGDWDNSGTDTVGLYVAGTGTWFLRNSNTPGPADLAFGYGPPNATPLAGDWDNQ